MRSSFFWISGIAFFTSGVSASAADAVMGNAGFTGLAITPSAHIQDWGTFSFTYDNQLPGITQRPDGHNFVAGFGLLPNLEIAGRVATNEINSNCYIACGARDLSGSAKFGIGLDANSRFRVAAGFTDIGGKVSYFTSYYGVATYTENNLDLSLGVAKRKSNGIARGTGVLGSESPLSGLFGSVVYQPASWLQTNLEYSDKNAWAGIKIFAPSDWLPRGWKAYVGANLRLNKNQYTEKNWINAGISIPLYSVPALPNSGERRGEVQIQAKTLRLPVYEALVLPFSEETTAKSAEGSLEPSRDATVLESQTAAARDPEDAVLNALAENLTEKGLEDISIGRASDGTIAITANNSTYSWNFLDALGSALGSVSKLLGEYSVGYRLVLTQRQIPIAAVTGQTNCLKGWILSGNPACTAGQIYTSGSQAIERFNDGVAWVVKGSAPSWKTLRIGLAPILNTAVATEYGLFDYSLGVRVAFTQPLWAGATAEIRQAVPIKDSDDYKPNQIYAGSRVKNVTERVIFTQTVRVPLERWLAMSDVSLAKWGATAVSMQANVGRINQHYDGVHGELRWEPGEGRHRFGIEGGRFRNSNFEPFLFGANDNYKEPLYANPLIASYRYAYMPTRTYFEASGGQFMYNDKGIYLGISQWFGDVSVSLYYRRTKFDADRDARQFVGVQLSVPIGPRKSMNPGAYVQIAGNQRVGYGVETLVRASTLNFVTLGHGVLPGVPTLNDTYNSDRAGLVYFEDNIRRIRDAARN